MFYLGTVILQVNETVGAFSYLFAASDDTAAKDQLTRKLEFVLNEQGVIHYRIVGITLQNLPKDALQELVCTHI